MFRKNKIFNLLDWILNRAHTYMAIPVGLQALLFIHVEKKKKDFNNLTTNCTTVKHRTIGYLHPAPGSSIPKAMDSLIGTELEATQILYISAIPHNTSFSVPSSPQRLSVQDPFPPNPISWNLNPQLQHIPHFYFKSPYPQSQKSFHQFFTP